VPAIALADFVSPEEDSVLPAGAGPVELFCSFFGVLGMKTIRKSRFGVPLF